MWILPRTICTYHVLRQQNPKIHRQRLRNSNSRQYLDGVHGQCRPRPFSWGKTFGVAINSVGVIDVVDYDNLRILKMNSAGQCLGAPLSTYGAGETGVSLNPTGIAIDSNDNVYVSDYGKKVIVKYDSSECVAANHKFIHAVRRFHGLCVAEGH